VLCKENGEVVTEVQGPSTNHWIIGIPEVVKRIAKMVNDAKQQANIPETTKIRSIGLSLSGCEQVSIAGCRFKDCFFFIVCSVS
jgi:N-acetylglucosamine kinase